MSEKRRKRCSMVGRELIPCTHLSCSSEGMNAHYKGVTMLYLIDLKDDKGDLYVGGALLKSGDFKKGVLMNYCPFCGAEILSDRFKEDKKEESEEEAKL